MPLPVWVRPAQEGEVKGTLVHLGGIAHLVVEDVIPSQDFFDQAESLFLDIEGLDAMASSSRAGHREDDPLVKVPAANTLVWEGSCGSGSLACAVAQSQGAPDGPFERDYIQPAGVVRATAVRTGGQVTPPISAAPSPWTSRWKWSCNDSDEEGQAPGSWPGA